MTATANRKREEATVTPDAKSFGRFKWLWLEQVYSDHDLPEAAHSVAFWLASKYLNAKSRDCWPSQETLAVDAGMKERWVRKLLSMLVDRGHLLVRRGGKGASNHYRPVLYDRHDNAGHDEQKTGTSMPVDRHDCAFKTGTIVPPNLSKEPLLEPAIRKDSGSTYQIEDTEDARVSARASVNHEISYETDEVIEVPGFGPCGIERIMRDRIIARSEKYGDTIRIGRDHSGKANFASTEVIEGD